MAHAFTPGLKVSPRTRIVKERKLPLTGEVLVTEGQKVRAEEIVARTQLPGNVEILKVAQRLGANPDELPHLMLKKVGDRVKEGEVIARSAGFFGLFRSEVTSPLSGTIESASDITGQVILRGEPIPVQVSAYIDGTVKEVFPKEGVAVETTASLIQGIFGVGGETHGELRVVARSPDEVLTKEAITPSLKDCVVVGGSFITAEAIEKASALGVRALIAGGISDEDLRKFLGYDIGVAVTGSEDIPVTLIVTEGFGRLRMAQRTFDLLKSRDGERCSVNGATQIRAGVLRPEIIIPYDAEAQEASVLPEEELSGELSIGTVVRIIREPYFGQLGTVVALPVELTRIATESKVRVLEVELESGKRVVLPRANVEIFEAVKA